MHRSTPRLSSLQPTFNIQFILVIALILSPYSVQAKISDGDFKLNGVSTERILTSFLVNPKGATLELNISADRPYQSRLFFRAYNDDVWKKFKRASTCSEKIRYAQHSIPVKMERDPDKTQKGEWLATIKLEIDKNERLTARNQHWYFVVDDCSLEEYFHDNKVPKFHYHLSAQNYRGRLGRLKTHMDAQQQEYPEWHAAAFLAAFATFVYLCLTAVWRLNSGAYEVHIAVMWILIAAACDMWGSIFEIAHLQMYHSNGKGSYVVDALAAYAEALCDSALVIVLLSVGAGWTLPPAHSAGVVNANAVQEAMQKLSGSPNNIKLIGAVVGFHLFVAQWGRMTSDDCESYHDLEHWPGFVLVWSRVLGGMVFLGTVQQTIRRRQQNFDLVTFYKRYAVGGTMWFSGLPVLSWFCSAFVSAYRRGMVLTVSSTLFESISIVCMAWMVTSRRTAFHRNSRMGTAPKEDSLTDRLVSPQSPTASAWKFGKKSKLRFD